MDFQAIPFDSHQCNLDFKNWIGSIRRINLKAPKILVNDENGQEIGGEELTIKSDGRLHYNFYIKTLSTSGFVDDGTEYSMAQVRAFAIFRLHQRCWHS